MVLRVRGGEEAEEVDGLHRKGSDLAHLRYRDLFLQVVGHSWNAETHHEISYIKITLQR